MMKNLFKLWHKEVKCWIRCNPCIFQDGQIGRWNSNTPFDFFNDEEIEIVRGAGIDDYKGRALYEGDILKRINVKTEKAATEKDFGLIVKDKETNNLVLKWFEYSDLYKKYTTITEKPLQSSKYYIFSGNTYENPKLLNIKQIIQER